jgi:hypothetical protein
MTIQSLNPKKAMKLSFMHFGGPELPCKTMETPMDKRYPETTCRGEKR